MKAKEAAASWKRGRAKRFFALRGGYAAILRMQARGCAAAGFGMAAGFDANQRTLLRWRRVFRAAQLACMKDFLIRSYMELDEPIKEGLRLAIHVIGADATTARVWQ